MQTLSTIAKILALFFIALMFFSMISLTIIGKSPISTFGIVFSASCAILFARITELIDNQKHTIS